MLGDLDHAELGGTVVDRHGMDRPVVDDGRLDGFLLDERHLAGPVLDRAQLDLTIARPVPPAGTPGGRDGHRLRSSCSGGGR